MLSHHFKGSLFIVTPVSLLFYSPLCHPCSTHPCGSSPDILTPVVPLLFYSPVPLLIYSPLRLLSCVPAGRWWTRASWTSTSTARCAQTPAAAPSSTCSSATPASPLTARCCLRPPRPQVKDTNKCHPQGCKGLLKLVGFVVFRETG